jgi:hypothetical protein
MLSLSTAAPSRHFPGDLTKKDGKPVGAFGWCSNGTKPLWRIERDTRLPLYPALRFGGDKHQRLNL